MEQKLENMKTDELVKHFFSLYHELEPEPKQLEISPKWWYED